MIKLENLGWNAHFAAAAQAQATEGWAPARVVRDGRDLWHVVGEQGEMIAALSGRFRHAAEARSDRPAVGDWVLLQTRPDEDRALIHAVLPRRTAFLRKVPGDVTQTQVVAANVDTVLLVSALDGGRNYNLRRIERYLALARESGASPVLLLNKVDLCADPEPYLQEVGALARGVPVHAVSALTGAGLGALDAYLVRGLTCALVGPSGVGKSALVNALSGGEVKETGEVRAADRRGRHTTTYRELLRLPSGALLMDNPGLREIQLWGDGEGLNDVFPDVEELAARCRFKDCRHEREPGCAVQAALADGTLDERRFANYRQLRGELDHLAKRKDHWAQLAEKRKWKAIHRSLQDHPKYKLRGGG
jgi:ribosome biogenesis GTPase